MADEKKNRVCPVERAGHLDNRFRRWFQNPRKIVGPYIREGMTVLDIGCGPGFFTLDMAHMVGPSGRVIAADLQEGMLLKLRNKIQGSALESRIVLHQSVKERIGVSGPVDFVLAFYIVHEIPDQIPFFTEIATIARKNGQLFVVEPPFHVSKKAFEKTVQKAYEAGFELVDRPRILFNKAALMRNSQGR